MNYIYYTALGLAPSLIWLMFYLHKDRHPEPKKLVLKIFLWGALMGPAAIVLQLATRWASQPTSEWSYFMATLGQNDFRYFLNIILFAPIIEEYLKYAVVKRHVLKDPSFDEPLDAMLYLIISALGFAAVENLLNIFLAPNLTIQAALSQATARFLSATFLHTLSSGLMGYFLALSLLNIKKRKMYLLTGFLLAIGFHGLYNFLAWLLNSSIVYAFALAFLLMILAGIITWQFYYLKKQLSICKLK